MDGNRGGLTAAPPDGGWSVPLTPTPGPDPGPPAAPPGPTAWSPAGPAAPTASQRVAANLRGRKPPTNGIPVVALGLGVVAAGVALVLPEAVHLVVVFAVLTLICGVSALRRAVMTGADGRWFATAAMVLAVAAIAVSVGTFAARASAAQDSMNEAFSLFGDLDRMAAEAEVASLELGGSGGGSVTLDGVALALTWRTCAFSNAAPGITVAAHASLYTPRPLTVVVSATSLGGDEESVSVALGGQTWVLEGQDVLQVADGRLSAVGTFAEVAGPGEVEGSLQATCTR